MFSFTMHYLTFIVLPSRRHDQIAHWTNVHGTNHVLAAFSSDTIASKFLATSRSDADFSDLSNRLNSRLIAELL